MTTSNATVIADAATDAQFRAALAAMWAEADYVDVQTQNWRTHLCVLMDWYGRDVVIASLIEAVPRLSMHEVTTLADLAEQEKGGARQETTS